jgi:hypothetical protein
MTIWYIWCSFGAFSGFGITHQDKSGNPGGMVKNLATIFSPKRFGFPPMA